MQHNQQHKSEKKINIKTMELGAQNLGWEILTPNEVEILKKAMPQDEPQVIDELNKAMQILRNGNVRLDEKLSVMLNILKAIVFLMQYTERNDVAVTNISLEEERFILRNLTKFAIFLIKSLSLNEILHLIKESAALIWKLLQQTGSGQGPNIAESSSSFGVDPSGPRNS